MNHWERSVLYHPMTPNEELLWAAVKALQEQVAELQRQTQQHYSNQQLSQGRFGPG